MKIQAIILLLFLFVKSYSQKIELVTDTSSYSIRNGHKSRIGIIYENAKGEIRKTEGLLGGNLRWKRTRIKSKYARVKKGWLKIKKSYTRKCILPLEVCIKKDKFEERIDLKLLFNGNVNLNFQPKKKSGSGFLNSLFTAIFSGGRDGDNGLDGLDAPYLIGELNLVQLCDQEMLLLAINHNGTMIKEWVNSSYRGNFIINLRGGNGEDGEDGEDETEKKDAGCGGDGGNGGRGGTLHVHLNENCKKYKDRIILLNEGGKKGMGGKAGNVYNNNYDSNGKTRVYSYRNGIDGINGQKGMDLIISIKP